MPAILAYLRENTATSVITIMRDTCGRSQRAGWRRAWARLLKDGRVVKQGRRYVAVHHDAASGS